MNQHVKKGLAAPPEAIYIIRHGEKPADPEPSRHGKPPDAPFGVDIEGNHSPHSLVPRGWQRAGGLVALFDPASGGSKAGLLTPTVLLSPAHGSPGKNAGHRTYQTIEGLGSRLGIEIDSTFAKGEEAKLAASVVSGYSGVAGLAGATRHGDRRGVPVAGTSSPTPDRATGTTVVWSVSRGVPDTVRRRPTFTRGPAPPAPSTPSGRSRSCCCPARPSAARRWRRAVEGEQRGRLVAGQVPVDGVAASSGSRAGTPPPARGGAPRGGGARSGRGRACPTRSGCTAQPATGSTGCAGPSGRRRGARSARWNSWCAS